MPSKVLLAVVCSAANLFAGEGMSISVCNIGQVPDKTVAHAETVVAVIFSPLQVEVSWTNCGESGPGVHILLRLRREGPLNALRADSLDVMGMAFTEEGLAGTMADAYYGAIEQFAKAHQADPGDVLGYVVAHEFGHLLLGPGHSAGSIMTAVWNRKTLEAARQRWLTFTQSQRFAIHRELQARTLLTGTH
jgi:hypothetical protein